MLKSVTNLLSHVKLCLLFNFTFCLPKRLILLPQSVIQVTPQDMADSFQPPFKTCVEEGKATSLMCAYSRLNGVSNCANYDLLTTTARRQWGFNG